MSGYGLGYGGYGGGYNGYPYVQLNNMQLKEKQLGGSYNGALVGGGVGALIGTASGGLIGTLANGAHHARIGPERLAAARASKAFLSTKWHGGLIGSVLGMIVGTIAGVAAGANRGGNESTKNQLENAGGG